MSDEIVPGMKVVRKQIYKKEIQNRFGFWSDDMLRALNTAKSMGATRFELEITDPVDVTKPQYLRVGGDEWNAKYEQTGTYTEQHQTITVYAVVVE